VVQLLTKTYVTVSDDIPLLVQFELFTGANGQLVFRNDAGEETPSTTLDQVLDAHVIDDVLMVDSSDLLDPADILFIFDQGQNVPDIMRTPVAPAWPL